VLHDSGWLECDGRSYTNRQYPDLYEVLRETWGSATVGLTFHVPDLHGMFLRGAQHAAYAKHLPQNDKNLWGNAIGDPESNATQRPWRRPNGATGDRVGSFQDSQNREHIHNRIFCVDAGQEITARFAWKSAGGGRERFVMDVSSEPLRTSGSGGPESRPPNVYVLYLIYAGRRQREEGEQD
jgi:hypothetical protein